MSVAAEEVDCPGGCDELSGLTVVGQGVRSEGHSRSGGSYCAQSPPGAVVTCSGWLVSQFTRTAPISSKKLLRNLSSVLSRLGFEYLDVFHSS